MGTIADKLSYLNDTKTQLKEILNKLGANILDNATFRSYLTHLDNLYNGLFNLTDMSKNGIVGRTSQEDTPTPTTPQEIENLSGDITYSVSGNNLLDLSSITTGTDSGISWSNNNGTITLNGTATAENIITSHSSTTGILLKKGTYTLSTNNSERSSYSNYVRLCTLDGTTISETSITYLNGKKTFTFDEDTMVRFQIRTPKSTTYNNFVIRPQLEKGSSVSQYQPYIPKRDFTISLSGDGYDIQLNKILDYEDKIYLKDNKFYLYKTIDKIVFNGSEDWEKSSVTSIDRFQVFLENGSWGISEYISHLAMCNYFPYNFPYNVAPTENTFHLVSGGSNTINLGFEYTQYGTTTLEQWKTWVSNNNLIVYYVSKTSTTTEITSTSHPTLYNQLKEIQDYLIKYKVNNELILNYSEPNIEY